MDDERQDRGRRSTRMGRLRGQPQPRATPRAVTLLLSIVLAAVGYYTLLFLAQRSMMFPIPKVPVPAEPLAGELVEVPHDDVTAVAILLSPLGQRVTPSPLLIFFHGNGELADFWIHEFDEPRRWGWAVLLVEYPGYGRAPGSPSERSIAGAALAVHDWARQDPRIDGSRIVPYGRSVGGGAAVRLAVEREVAALVLESSWTSARAFAARFLAPGFLVRDPFDNVAALSSYEGPLLVMHGRHDTIIPPGHGLALARSVPGAEHHELPCGHNDCERPWPELRAFLERHIPDAPVVAP